MSPFDLSGKVAIVTGGNGGIGLGMARGLAQAGAHVVITGRNERKNDAAIESLRSAGAEVLAVSADLTDPAAPGKLVGAAVDRYSRLDILINNAGTNIRKQPEDYAIEEWRQVLDINLSAVFALCQTAYPEMCRGGGGKIVNIGSMMSIFGASFTAAYAASKGGIVQMSKSLACAWAKDNIQVNAVLPGWIDTDLTRHARREVDGLHEKVLGRTPAGRWGDPRDMAGIGVFLASPASDFVTGTAIPVDGGFSAQG